MPTIIRITQALCDFALVARNKLVARSRTVRAPCHDSVMQTVKAPFHNLEFPITLNRVLGLVSCRLVNGRFKQSSIWNRCYCALWLLLHCAYSSVYYYTSFTALSAENIDIYAVLPIVRFSAFFVSLLPFHFVVVSRSRDFVKFSDKLEAYDEKAATLGYRRKNNHIFTWFYFAYTFATLFMKTYYAISSNVEAGATAIVTQVFENLVPTIVGAYCVFIMGIYLDAIRQRFRHLNVSIVPHVAELPVTGSQGEITVYDVRYLHGVLINSAELIDALYGTGTLLVFASILLEFVSVIYLLIRDVDNDNTLVTILDLLFQVFYLFAMYHFTTMEANHVEECVMKYGLSFQNPKCRMDKIEMILYFYHGRFFFTAAGFFVLDLIILLSIASTVTTFITLII